MVIDYIEYIVDDERIRERMRKIPLDEPFPGDSVVTSYNKIFEKKVNFGLVLLWLVMFALVAFATYTLSQCFCDHFNLRSDCSSFNNLICY